MSGAEQQKCLGNLLRAGQSQRQRLLPALDPASAPVDERDLQQWLDFATQYAQQLNFFNPQSNQVDGNWSSFFSGLPADVARQLAFDIDLDAVEQSFAARGDLPPHLGLLISFLRLTRHARNELNGITGRHLEHFYRDVLRLQSRPFQPDRVHLLFALKKQVKEQLLTKGSKVSAGKDATKKELIFTLANDLGVFPVSIDSLRSVFVDAANQCRVHLAPISNSADGLGAELDKAAPHWSAFGSAALPQAQIGFAFAAPVLAMQEGSRTVRVEMALSGLPDGLDLATGQVSFQAYLSGAKGWLGPKSVALLPVAGQAGRYQVEFSLSAAEDAVTGYQRDLHGHSFDSDAPVLQLLLDQQQDDVGYAALQQVKIGEVEIQVTVEGVSTLQLENDFGSLDPAKPFMPFGPQAKQGATFYIGHAEAFHKRLESFSLKLQWLNAPANFASHYADSGYRVSSNAAFTVKLTGRIDGEQTEATVKLFDDANATSPHRISVPDDGGSLSRAQLKVLPLQQAKRLSLQKNRWASRRMQRAQLVSPIHWYYPLLLGRTVTAPRLRDGYLSLRLNQGFLHQEYMELYTKRVVAAARTAAEPVLPKAPYTPLLESLTLSYTATSGKIDLAAQSSAELLRGELNFFQIAAFGQRRDHSHLRRQLAFLPAKTVSLLPEYPYEGEFYLGFSGIEPGRNLSLLFQVADGSGDPALSRPQLDWSILSDNHWRPLSADELLSDGSNGLLTSGVIRFKLPDEATSNNTLLPAGHYWLRGAVAQNSRALCRLVAVQPNAVLAVFQDNGNDPERLRQPLPAKSISKLVNSLATIKSVAQPYASFGGRMAEDDSAFRVRVSERLRHKGRAVSAWDVERLVLEQFPEIYLAKCLTHTAPDSCQAPGHLTLVVVPDLQNRNAVDPLRPRADLDTLDRIQRYLQQLCGPTVSAHTANPNYQTIRVAFKVRFRQQLDFGFYRKLLNDAIIRYLSPWAFDGGREISFGGKLHKTVILQQIEQLDYVDYLTEFKLFSGDAVSKDLAQVQATDPQAILVSAAEHDIRKL
ncbi:MAG TPA: hypothetical protein VIR78_14435 [Malonomonas sp.]